MADEPAAPGRVEATALAIAGPAFAASLLFLRTATPVDHGVFDGSAAALVALGIAPWVHRWRGAFAGTLTRGAGLALGTLLFSTALVPPFFSATAPVAIAILAGSVLQANARRARPSATLDGVALAALAGAFALGLVIASGFPEPGRLRLTLVVVAVATAVLLAIRRVLVASARWRSLAPMPLGVLLVSTIGGIYLSYRGLVGEHVANLPLYEWTLASCGAGLLLARLRRSAKAREARDGFTGEARRHAQDVRPVYDERMGAIAAVVARYLEQGVGYDDYVRAMTTHGVPASAIAPAAPPGRLTRGSKRDAARARNAAHQAAMRAVLPAPPPSPSRPPPSGVQDHGEPQPNVR